MTQLSWPEPDAAAQLVFLQHLQRLFQEGDFSATYKYALLLALAELAIECDCADGAPLEIPMLRIAEKFTEFYWLQATPYIGERDTSGVLIQNKGKQAAVVRHLIGLRSVGVATMAQARQHARWDSTIRDIARVVRDMPVRFLQNIPGGTVHFLYDPESARRSLTLLPGVAFNLRRFQGFIQQLVRAGWSITSEAIDVMPIWSALVQILNPSCSGHRVLYWPRCKRSWRRCRITGAFSAPRRWTPRQPWTTSFPGRGIRETLH